MVRIKPRIVPEALELAEEATVPTPPPKPAPPSDGAAAGPIPEPVVEQLQSIVDKDLREAGITSPEPVEAPVRPKVAPIRDDQMVSTETPMELDIQPMGHTIWYLKALFYGSPGVGKTVLAASAEDVPDLQPMLFCDAEAGTLSIRSRKFDVLRVDTYEKLRAVVAHLRGNPRGYRTVVFDSLSEIQRLMLKHIVKEAAKDDADHDKDLPELRDYLRLADRMRTLMRILRDLPIHIIITALDRESKDEREGTITVGPGLLNSVSNEVCAFQDLVGYLTVVSNKETGDVVRKLLVQPTGKYAAKDRSGTLERILDAPTMKSIYKSMTKKGKEGKKTDDTN
jgi:phage nucleotide-binding protein